jgi:5-methylcytosine-specific restriction protein A
MNLGSIWPDIGESEYIELPAPTVDSALEGHLELVTHLRRERNSRLLRAKKAAVLRETGRLICEACGFDFAATYGRVGFGFCEVHHERPLATLKRARRYDISELKVLCSNCHRIIHKTSPILKVAVFAATLNRRV